MELAAAQAAPALSFFDKGLAVAVIAFCGCAAEVSCIHATKLGEEGIRVLLSSPIS